MQMFSYVYMVRVFVFKKGEAISFQVARKLVSPFHLLTSGTFIFHIWMRVIAYIESFFLALCVQNFYTKTFYILSFNICLEMFWYICFKNKLILIRIIVHMLCMCAVSLFSRRNLFVCICQDNYINFDYFSLNK